MTALEFKKLNSIIRIIIKDNAKITHQQRLWMRDRLRELDPNNWDTLETAILTTYKYCHGTNPESIEEV